jgi:UDP-galactopyranose mutase
MYKQAGIYVHKTLVNKIVYNIYYSDLTLPWIILLPGLPQYIHKQSYLKKLISNYCILNPYYPGSFHSYGEFRVANLRRLVKESINLVSNKKFFDYFEEKKYNHSGLLEAIWGLSFGANLLYDYLLQKPNLYCDYLFVAPMFNLQLTSQKRYWEQKLSFLSKEVYMNVYRGLNKSEFLKWMRDLEDNDIDKKKYSIKVLYGEDDKYMDENFLSKKFSTTSLFPVKGYGHEIDNMLESHII